MVLKAPTRGFHDENAYTLSIPLDENAYTLSIPLDVIRLGLNFDDESYTFGHFEDTTLYPRIKGKTMSP